MDFFMGIKGKDFVLVCTDTSAVHSIITIKQDEDKIIPVDSHKVFCIAGEAGDRVQFSDYIIANVKLYSLRNSTSLSTRSVANYARGELATALRKVRASLHACMHACHASSRHWGKLPGMLGTVCRHHRTPLVEVCAHVQHLPCYVCPCCQRPYPPLPSLLLLPQSPYHCNLLVAGYDEGAGASLYWCDYLATLHKVNTGGTGYGEQLAAGWRSRVAVVQAVPSHAWPDPSMHSVSPGPQPLSGVDADCWNAWTAVTPA